jgi:hypothetical protein
MSNGWAAVAGSDFAGCGVVVAHGPGSGGSAPALQKTGRGSAEHVQKSKNLHIVFYVEKRGILRDNRESGHRNRTFVTLQAAGNIED